MGEQQEKRSEAASVLFYPSDNLTQTIFHLHFSICHQGKKKVEKTGQWKGTEKVFLFHRLSQQFGGNQMEQTRSKVNWGLFTSSGLNLQ